MSVRPFSNRIVRWFSRLVAVAAVVFLGFCAPGRALADERGTIGLVLMQLYDDSKADHRGPLAVMHVMEDSPADKAGIHCSDFIVAVNGAPVPGRDFSEILQKDLRGPVGGKVALTIVRFNGSKSDITLVRAPYPAHTSEASDPFTFQVPGSWSADPRYTFPLPFAPKLAYHGVEDVFFAPNFDDTDSPEYHSWLFFMWLDGTHVLSAEQVQADMVTYFQGLAEERGQNNGFTPDLSKVTATYKENTAASPTYGGAPDRAFSGTVDIWDRRGKVITVNSEVRVTTCGTPDHTILFFGGSQEPRDANIWKEIDVIRDTFRCRR